MNVGLTRGRVELLPWSVASGGSLPPVEGLCTFGHPIVDGAMLDRLPGLKVISNYGVSNDGVGVDHIDLAAARERSIAVGNRPGVLEGATADLAFALLLASARRVVEGDRYARSASLLADSDYVVLIVPLTEQSRRRLVGRSVSNLLAGLQGEPPPFAVRP
jgi:glyoxylate reductase